MLAGMALFMLLTSGMNWIKYVSLRSTYPYDLAAFNNPMANFSAGRDRTYFLTATWFSPGDHDGPSIFRSSHFTPLRLWILPWLYRLWPHIILLMLAQSAFLASGAWALNAFARRHTQLRWPGLVLAASYLFHPLTLHMGFGDFREIQLGIGPALFALAAHAERRWRAFALATFVMLCARPEFAFLLVVFPLLNWRLTGKHARGRAWLLLPALVAGAWYAVACGYAWYLYGVAVPHLAHSGPISNGLFANLPARLPAFLRLTLLPGLLAVFTPEAFGAVLPFVAAARDVGWPRVPQDHLQHLSPALAATMWAFTSTLVRHARGLVGRPRRRAITIAVLALAASISFGQFAWEVSTTYLLNGYLRYAKLDAIEAAVPRDATVVVPDRLVARFSGHTRTIDYQHLPVDYAAPVPRAAFFTPLIAIADVVATEHEEWLDDLVVRSDRFAPAVTVAGVNMYLALPDSRSARDPDAVLEELFHWPAQDPRRCLWLRRPPLAARPAGSGS